MKTWLKACLLGTIAFISLFTLALIIAYAVMTKQGQFASEHHEPLAGMYHNPEAEGMINHMDNIAAEFNVSRVHNLDNHDDRKFLETNGLILKPGQVGHFKAIENPSTGFTWQIDEKACKDHIEITAEYTSPPEKKG